MSRSIALFLALAGSVHAQNEPPRVLFLTHSAGFTHSVARRPAPDRLAHAERVFQKAARGRMDIVPTQDCADINAENLARFDAVLFYTTGELPITPESRTALMQWIRAGGAFAGSHCATDTLYEYPPYVDLIGGNFDGHPWHEEVTVRVEDTTHPATKHLGESFVITDEIYQFKNYSRIPLHVLLSLDNASVEIGKGKRTDGDYALAWCRDYGQGRMFYTALGHREEVWTDERFQEHLMAGIEWAIAGPRHFAEKPADAVPITDWRGKDGEAKWKQTGGVLEVVPGTGNHFSTEELAGAFRLHVEFNVPKTPQENRWQDRGNSGVYVQGRYEVQVLDSFGLELRSGDCGGIYGKHVPVANACRPAGEWQSYDLVFRSPRLGADGKKTANARMTVWHNGIRIHDDVEVDGTTAAAMAGDEPGKGPLMLQDHGHAVRYRNVWYEPHP
ncbi:MAG: DUF1080 domain-containing protein [bacterium]|nr:DUF1080 domain-containing protein [bacterium]